MYMLNEIMEWIAMTTNHMKIAMNQIMEMTIDMIAMNQNTQTMHTIVMNQNTQTMHTIAMNQNTQTMHTIV